NYFRENQKEIDPPGHATDLFSNWAVDYLNKRKDKKQPFFLYLAYNAPHTPIQPPPDWLAKVKAREKGIAEPRAKLVALIEHMDDGIGKVIATLKANGQYENTLIIFSSDNGGQLNVGARCGNHRGGKQDMYEGGLKVPTCAVWPGRIQPGTRSHLSGLSMDFYPTACAVAGANVPSYVEGVSLLPAFLGKPQKLERDMIFMRREGGHLYNGQDYHALRRGDWKLVHNRPDEPLQLYHLGDDPLEKNDLAAKEPRKLKELKSALRNHFQRAGQVPWQRPAK
ncbi:MAG: sulfatase-like hydrolase/transferase, partial [Verrucomicrobiales bacterium]|nr:sulfatase-like hydrolase/transferase [Verrucomicrobiales bacterium]